jgi:hypothetical protein
LILLRRRSPQNTRNRMLLGIHSWSRCFAEGKNSSPLTEIQPQIVGCSAHTVITTTCTLFWTISTGAAFAFTYTSSDVEYWRHKYGKSILLQSQLYHLWIAPTRCTICFQFNMINSLYMFWAPICSSSEGTVYTTVGIFCACYVSCGTPLQSC